MLEILFKLAKLGTIMYENVMFQVIKNRVTLDAT
jgi:hypothetical protein